MSLGGGALRLPHLANVVRAEVGGRLDQVHAPLVALPHGVDGAQRNEGDGTHADEPAEGLDVVWVRVVAPVGGHEVVNRHEENDLRRRDRFENEPKREDDEEGEGNGETGERALENGKATLDMGKRNGVEEMGIKRKGALEMGMTSEYMEQGKGGNEIRGNDREIRLQKSDKTKE